MTPEAIETYRSFGRNGEVLIQDALKDAESMTPEKIQAYMVRFEQMLTSLYTAHHAVAFGERFPEARLMATTALRENE